VTDGDMNDRLSGGNDSAGQRTDAFLWPSEIYAEALGGADRIPVFSRSPSVKLYRHTLARYVRPGMGVLDIGCGFTIGGCHLAAMGAFGITYTGVDIEPRVCERARGILARLPRDLVRGDVVCSDASAFLPACARKFEIALCNYSFHACLPTAGTAVGAGLGEGVAATLRPGGVLIVADAFIDEGTPVEEVHRIKAYAARAAGHLCTGVHRDPGSVCPAQMESTFRRAGLHLLESRDVPWFVLSTYRGMPHARYALRVFVKPR
jgi:SAM-dependent methyltransferase